MRKRLPQLMILMILGCMLTGCFGPARVTKETEATVLGIDVAKYQGTIDWQKLKESGVAFAMIRVGYRSMADGIIQEDSNGRYNLQEAAKAEIPVGVYFFSTAMTEEEAEEEARWVADFIAPYPVTYPVAYDCEKFRDPDSRQYGMSEKERTDAALAFLKTIERRGYEGMFYASKNEIDAQWELHRIENDYKIWVAQYPAEPYPATQESSYEGDHHMWQYSESGAMPGISQPVDLNIAYFAYDGIEPAKSNKIPEAVGPDPEALMSFDPVSDMVTAKSEVNLRSIPSQDEDSEVLRVLNNGEVAERIAVSDSGWSKLRYNGEIFYAVSNYLTTDMNYTPVPEYLPPEDGVQTQFVAVHQQVTAKDTVNLRKLPSVEHEDADVIIQLKKGDMATCIGVSENGWSKLKYKGLNCYAVTSYLEVLSESSEPYQAPEPEAVQMPFEAITDLVTAKKKVNLRSLPSVDDPNCEVIIPLNNGDVATRIGINKEEGWSKVVYCGRTLYCLSSYLKSAE